MQILRILLVGATLLGAGAVGWAAGCGGSSSNGAAPLVDAGGDASTSPACPACVTDNDCNGGVCAQFGGDTYCAPACPSGNECASDRQCMPVSSATGDQKSVCVPRGDLCGPTDTGDAGTPPPQTCGSLVGPDVKAGCNCSPGKQCTANGCYGGWWCNTATNRCQSPPTSCAASDGGTGVPGVPYDAGGPVVGDVGGDGGTESRLYFGVVGDTRPATVDDTGGYPTAIITKVFTSLAAMDPSPPFVVSTGDYMFATVNRAQAAPQLDLYLGARAKYPGVAFPTMGNHECTGFTASNCGTGNVDGTTDNYNQFIAKMLAPIGKSDVYFEVDVDAKDASWTCKLLFVAGNAWSTAQATWLEQAMTRATTYTFIVRHEPANANTAPGVTPSETIMAKHPYTLAIVGHTHTYVHYGTSREVIVGNGGAPLSGNKNFGFGVISQRADQTLDVDMIDYASGLADPQFHFAVKPDGTVVP